MDQDRIDGISHQFGAPLTAGNGKIIGDGKVASGGAGKQAAGKAQTAIGSAKDAATGMDRDPIEGVGHQFRGAIKEGFGHIAGDPAIEADGAVERAAGKVRNAAGCGQEEVRDAIEKAPAPAMLNSRSPMAPPHDTCKP